MINALSRSRLVTLECSRRRACGTLVLGALICAPALHAQSAPTSQAAAGQPELAEVVVTAQFHSQTAQTTPLSLTALSGAALQARGQTTVDQIAAEAPNVTLEPTPAVMGPAIGAYIRGVGQSDSTPGESPGVGMYIDDVYYGTILGSDFKLLDLSRVEILRGPQGTLAGQNSIGGSIKLYTVKPNGNSGASVEVGYGSLNDVTARATGDTTLIPGRLYLRAVGAAEHQDGYVDRLDYGCTHPQSGVPSGITGTNCLLGTEGGKAWAAGRIALRWTPTDDVDALLTADYTQDNSEASPNVLLYAAPGKRSLNSSNSIAGMPEGNATGSPFITYSPFGPYGQDQYTRSPYVTYSTFCNRSPNDGSLPYCDPADNRVQGGGLSGDVTYHINDSLSVRSITAYRRLITDWSNDNGGSPVGDGQVQSNLTQRQFSEELRVNGSVANRLLQYTVGLFYFDAATDYRARVDLPAFGWLEDDYIPSSTRAGYANLDWRLTGKLEVNTGVRYTHQNLSFRYGRGGMPGIAATTFPPGPLNGAVAPFLPCTQAGGEIVNVAVCPLNGTYSDFNSNHVDYRIAPQYQWTPGLMTYVSVATGFKGGGSNPRPLDLGQEQPFGPETITAYEIGAKTEWLDHRLRVNAALFYNDYDDIQITVRTCPQFGPAPGCAAPVNAGKAVIDGAELETQFQATDALKFDASASYLNFRFTSLSADALASGISLGMKAPFTPKWKGDLGVEYEIHAGGLGIFTPRLDASYQYATFDALPNDQFSQLPSRTLMNAHIAWDSPSGNWQIAAHVINLADKVYYYTYFNNITSTGTVLGEVAPPREWLLTVKETF